MVKHKMEDKKMEKEKDMGAKIMQERIQWGLEMVKEASLKEGIDLSEAIFIKGIEVGISLYIQKEKNYKP